MISGFVERHFAPIIIAPALLVLLAMMIGPLLFTLALSVLRWDLTDPTAGIEFVGFGNYLEALRTPGFFNAVRVSLVFTLVAVALEVTFGLALALLATARRTTYSSSMRVALLAPAMLNPAIAAIIWRWIFAPDYGVLNYMLSAWVGVSHPPQWLASDTWALPSIIIVNAWITTPFVMLILVAALQAIPDELYEAAAIDGAGSWARFVSVTLPLLRRALMVVLVLRTIDAFRLFDLVFILTKGGPGTTTETLAFYIFRVGFNYWQIGFAGALSVIMFLLVLVMSILYVRMVGE
jgi:multiple sugar transport system permease protein